MDKMEKSFKVEILFSPNEYIAANTKYSIVGKDYTVGNDLSDGSWNAETLERIFEDIRAVFNGKRK